MLRPNVSADQIVSNSISKGSSTIASIAFLTYIRSSVVCFSFTLTNTESLIRLSFAGKFCCIALSLSSLSSVKVSIVR